MTGAPSHSKWNSNTVALSYQQGLKKNFHNLAISIKKKVKVLKKKVKTVFLDQKRKKVKVFKKEKKRKKKSSLDSLPKQ